MSITVKAVSKQFGSFQALDRVSVEAAEGQLLALLGPSGSGKTTLLRIIAGLEAPDSGSVLYEDEEVTTRPARDRNVGFVFQHYALFRHMDVFENVAFGLRVRRWPQARVRERVRELLRLIRLEGQERRYPNQLSGGQRQRVALARALAAQPRVLLLDEPFGALDARVRQELRDWLRRLHDEIHVTSIFVTHDQEEAFAVADQVVVLRGGRVEQAGTPREVFEHPANAFVMDFLGNVNVFQGHLQDGIATCHGRDGRATGLRVQWPHDSRPDCQHTSPTRQRGPTPDPSLARRACVPVSVYIRPHELEIDRTPDDPASALKARVVHVNSVGAVAKVHLQALDTEAAVLVELSLARAAELDLQAGEVVAVVPKKVRVFVPDYAI